MTLKAKISECGERLSVVVLNVLAALKMKTIFSNTRLKSSVLVNSHTINYLLRLIFSYEDYLHASPEGSWVV